MGPAITGTQGFSSFQATGCTSLEVSTAFHYCGLISTELCSVPVVRVGGDPSAFTFAGKTKAITGMGFLTYIAWSQARCGRHELVCGIYVSVWKLGIAILPAL